MIEITSRYNCISTCTEEMESVASYLSDFNVISDDEVGSPCLLRSTFLDLQLEYILLAIMSTLVSIHTPQGTSVCN